MADSKLNTPNPFAVPAPKQTEAEILPPGEIERFFTDGLDPDEAMKDANNLLQHILESQTRQTPPNTLSPIEKWAMGIYD